MLEDCDAAADVGKGHVDVAIESSGSREGFIEGFREVGRADDDDAGVLVEAIEFCQELVEGLLGVGGVAFVAFASDRIQLVDEDNRRSLAFRGGEEIADEMERVVRGEKLKDKLKVDVGAAVKVPEGNVMPPLPLPPLGGATGGKGGSEEGVGSPSA